MAYLGLPQACQRRGRCRRSEHRPEAVRRMPIVAELVGVERLCQPAADIVSERDRADKRSAVLPLPLGHGQGRRHDAAAGMRERRRMRVVGFVGVSKHAVNQCGVYRGRNDAAPDHAGFFDAAEGFHVADRFFPGRKTRPRHHSGDRVQDVVFGLFDHRRRKRPTQRLSDVAA